MDLMQLEMFVAAAELRSVQRASERVFRTQPAVSMAIRKLPDLRADGFEPPTRMVPKFTS